MRKVWLLDKGDIRQEGDKFLFNDKWEPVASIGLPVPNGFTCIREIEGTTDIATEEKIAALEARLRYVENELQANKDLRQNDLVVAATEKKWRTPNMPNDYGKLCFFSDIPDQFGTACEGELAGFCDGELHPFIDQGGSHWKYARIEVTE